MNRWIVRKGRFILTAFIVMAFLWCIATIHAQSIQVRRMVPPKEAFQLVLGPDNTAMLTLAPGDNAVKGPVELSLRPFWTRDNAPVDVVFKSGSDAEAGKKREVEIGEPVILQVTDADGEQAGSTGKIPMAWGYIDAGYTSENGKEKSLGLPVAIGAFGPAPEEGGTLPIPAAGRYKMELDMSDYVVFGEAATFQFTSFSSGVDNVQPRFFGDEDEAVDLLTVNYSADNPTIRLEIDAGKFQCGAEYTGALRMRIDDRQFIDSPLVFKRSNWDADASFAPIPPTITKDKNAILAVRAASNKDISGIFVTNATTPTDSFDPRKVLDVEMNGVSLWPEESDRNQAIKRASLAPGDVREITVRHHGNLPAGRHDISLVVGALNVGVDKGAEAKITFVVRNSYRLPIIILVLSVLLSYIITKGIFILVTRRKLKKRITGIKNEPWIRNDRWGALPIVRAIVRVELADKALREKSLNPAKFLSRLVTTPQLISDEIKEVEKRLDVFKKLNKYAIYWGTAPSDVGSAGGMDYRIVWRARKVLRGIVEELSRLYKGEEIPTELVGRIDGMEKWFRQDSLRTEYWAALLRDVNRLLMQVDLHRFEFDQSDLDRIVENLNAVKQGNYNQEITDAAISSLAACHTFKEKGMPALAEALRPITALLDDTSVADQQLIDWVNQILECRQRVASSVRETARELAGKLGTKNPPESMGDILAMDDNYIRLMLLWGQRSNKDSCRKLVEQFHDDTALKAILEAFDDEIWELLKEPGTLRIADPASIRPVEQYALTDFKVECVDKKADSFLYRHGVQYEWRIEYGGKKPLTPVTRCPMVTQFIPEIGESREVRVSVNIRRGDEKISVMNDGGDHVSFTTLPGNRYKNLWPTNTPELLGVAIALLLALIAGFQSDAFENALEGSWKEYLTLFAWGVGAEQIKTLIQNMEKPFKNEQAGS